jgi:hypothetical protein
VLSGLVYEDQKNPLAFSSLELEMQIFKKDHGDTKLQNMIRVEFRVDSSFGSTLLCARLRALVGDSEQLVLSHDDREERSRKRLSDIDDHLKARACTQDSLRENLRASQKDSDMPNLVIPTSTPTKR